MLNDKHANDLVLPYRPRVTVFDLNSGANRKNVMGGLKTLFFFNYNN